MRKRITPSKVVIIAFVTFYAVFSIIPIVFIVNHAFKPLYELFQYPPNLFVRSPSLANFYELIFAMNQSVVPFSRFLFNSVFVTGVTIFLSVTLNTMGAYPLSKIQFKGKNVIFNIILVALMFVPDTVRITRYLIITNLGIMNTYLGHILPLLAMPISIFLIKQFMDQIPTALSEAAKIDGANEWTIFTRIIIPNIKPALGTAMILAFQDVWVNSETSAYYMTSESMKTLPYFVQTLNAGLVSTSATAGQVVSVARQGASAAAGLMMFIPNFIIFLVLQKSMMSTLVNSGIK
jgi:ABC-type glycerol-3-phosphate transport system permease component